MKIKRILSLLFALLMVVSILAGCSDKAEQQKKFETFEDFENARLGVLTGSVFDKQTGELFPDAKKYNFDTIVDLLVNIDENKIDNKVKKEVKDSLENAVETEISAYLSGVDMAFVSVDAKVSVDYEMNISLESITVVLPNEIPTYDLEVFVSERFGLMPDVKFESEE